MNMSQYTAKHKNVRWTLHGVALGMLALLIPSARATSPNPGGKQYFVAAMGKLDGSSTEHVRVAMITFNGSVNGNFYGATAGRVSYSGWAWKKNATSGQFGYCGTEFSGTAATSQCSETGVTRYSPNGELFNNGRTWQRAAIGDVPTATSYRGSATDTRQGDFYIDTSTSPAFVLMRWDDGRWETWNLSVVLNEIVKLTWRSSTIVDYNLGVMAGSNAPFSDRRAMSTIRQHAALPTGSAGGIVLPDYSVCGSVTWMLNESHYHSNPSCSCSPTRTYKNNWIVRISTTDRRDTWHYWCHCLAWDKSWYTGGTHQKMLLQALDDSGAFRGWVGVGADKGFAHPAVLTNYVDF